MALQEEVGKIIVACIKKIRPNAVSMRDDRILSLALSELMLDSLDTTTLCLDIEDNFGVVLNPEELLRCGTLLDFQSIVVRFAEDSGGELKPATDSLRFRELTVDDAEQTLRWRRLPRISEQMVTEVNHGIEEQRSWIEQSFGDQSYYHWIIQIGNQDIGLISLSNYDQVAATCSWGFYIGEDSVIGIGALIPNYFHSWLFKKLGVHLVSVEVIAGNTQVVEIHKLHGYRRTPGGDRTVVRNGDEKRFLSYSLSYREWNTPPKFHGNQGDFPTKFWTASPASLDVQDQ